MLVTTIVVMFDRVYIRVREEKSRSVISFRGAELGCECTCFALDCDTMIVLVGYGKASDSLWLALFVRLLGSGGGHCKANKSTQ